MDQSLGDEATLGPGEAGRGPELDPGDRIDVYRVIRLLGRGGMGEVYEVEHEKLGTRYALKIIPSRLANQPGFVERFEREAQVMAKLEHPGIVRVGDFRETDGRYWLRMELIGGIALRLGDRKVHATSLTDLASLYGGKLPQRALAGLLLPILDALGFAHKHGVVHRDLKPNSIALPLSPYDGPRLGIPYCRDLHECIISAPPARRRCDLRRRLAPTTRRCMLRARSALSLFRARKVLSCFSEEDGMSAK